MQNAHRLWSCFNSTHQLYKVASISLNFQKVLKLLLLLVAWMVYRVVKILTIACNNCKTMKWLFIYWKPSKFDVNNILYKNLKFQISVGFGINKKFIRKGNDKWVIVSLIVEVHARTISSKYSSSHLATKRMIF